MKVSSSIATVSSARGLGHSREKRSWGRPFDDHATGSEGYIMIPVYSPWPDPPNMTRTSSEYWPWYMTLQIWRSSRRLDEIQAEYRMYQKFRVVYINDQSNHACSCSTADRLLSCLILIQNEPNSNLKPILFGPKHLKARDLFQKLRNLDVWIIVVIIRFNGIWEFRIGMLAISS